MEPIKLYGGGQSPNPIKVAIILEELGLPYEATGPVNLQSPEYLAVNPNGKCPSIHDPNTGVTMFESCAIIEYLVETYDKDHTFSYANPKEKWLERSWLYFQGTGQGPYYGQAGWFQFMHTEKVPTAITRYQNEAKRICSVIDAHLTRHGTPYLIGDKVSHADLAWLGWNAFLDKIVVPGWDFAAEYPAFGQWHKSLIERPAVKKVLESPDFNYSLH